MNDPLSQRLQAAVEADAVPVALSDLEARARLHRLVCWGSPVVVFAALAGGVALCNVGPAGSNETSVLRGEPSIASSDVAETSTPTPVSTPVPTKISPSVRPSLVAPPPPTVVSTETSDTPSPTRPVVDPTKALTVVLIDSSDGTQPGDEAKIGVMITNASDQSIRMTGRDGCQGAIQVVSASLLFTGNADCTEGRLLAPGQTRTARFGALVPLNYPGGSTAVTVRTSFILSNDDSGAVITSVHKDTVLINRPESGYVLLVNDSDIDYRLVCRPGCEPEVGTRLQPLLRAGQQRELSVFVEDGGTTIGLRPAQSGSLRRCLIVGVQAAMTTNARVSQADVCASD